MGKVFSRFYVRRKAAAPHRGAPVEASKALPGSGLIDYESEHDKKRLRSNHESYKELLNGNFQSPVHEVLETVGAQVLDIGSGQGIWILEMAKDYPKSMFTGMDVDANLFPKSHPSNCVFLCGDVTNGLPFPDCKFDFVFSRLMVMSFTQSQWAKVLTELVRVTKPGGYIELIEPDMECLHMGPYYERWNREVLSILREKKFMPSIGRHLGNLLDDIPSITLIKSDFAVSEKIGFKEDVRGFFRAMKTPLLPRLQMTSEEYDQFAMLSIKECDDYESFLNIHYAFGRKDSDTDKFSTVSSRG